MIFRTSPTYSIVVFVEFSKRQIFLTVIGDHLNPNNLYHLHNYTLQDSSQGKNISSHIKFFRNIVTGFSAKCNAYLNVSFLFRAKQKPGMQTKLSKCWKMMSII